MASNLTRRNYWMLPFIGVLFVQFTGTVLLLDINTLHSFTKCGM